MPLVAPVRAFGKTHPEKLFLFGPSCSGKTHNVLGIADFLRLFNTQFAMHYVDVVEEAVPANIEAYPELAASGLINWIPVKGFAEAEVVARDLKEKIKPGPADFIVVDRVSLLWDDAPRHYVKTRLKADLEELEMDYRRTGKSDDQKGAKKGSALLEYYTGGINPMWRAFLNRIFTCGCNVIFVASEKDLIRTGERADSAETLRLFKRSGCKPDSNKKDHTFFHSILFLSQPYDRWDQWNVTTIRERGASPGVEGARPWYDREDITGVNFGQFYLAQTAGWHLQP